VNIGWKEPKSARFAWLQAGENWQAYLISARFADREVTFVAFASCGYNARTFPAFSRLNCAADNMERRGLKSLASFEIALKVFSTKCEEQKCLNR